MSQEDNDTAPESAHMPSQAEFDAWLQATYEMLGHYAVSQGAIPGKAQGRVANVIPFNMLLVKFWPHDAPKKACWVIGGGELPADVIEVKLAAGPREAVRHFSLRWHMQAERLAELRGKGAGSTDEAGWQRMSESLSKQAEMLYQFAERDDLWTQPPTPDSPAS